MAGTLWGSRRSAPSLDGGGDRSAELLARRSREPLDAGRPRSALLGVWGKDEERAARTEGAFGASEHRIRDVSERFWGKLFEVFIDFI